MDWQILLIPLLALVVWIVGTLFKSEDDKTKKGVRGRGTATGRAPGRRPVADLDRFLDEARRRREVEARPKPGPAPPPVRVSSETRPAVRERPTRLREAPRVAVPAFPKEEVLEVLPAARPASPALEAQPVASPRLSSAPATPPPATFAAPRPAPVLQQVRELLSKPQTAATAFALREIFDRPLCRRRR